jgi:hypothetical protein
VAGPVPTRLKTREYRCSSAVLLFRDVKKGQKVPKRAFFGERRPLRPLVAWDIFFAPPPKPKWAYGYTGEYGLPLFDEGRFWSKKVKFDQKRAKNVTLVGTRFPYRTGEKVPTTALFLFEIDLFCTVLFSRARPAQFALKPRRHRAFRRTGPSPRWLSIWHPETSSEPCFHVRDRDEPRPAVFAQRRSL